MDLKKLENFLQISQETQKQLTEALAVGKILKEEVTLSREVDRSLRLQLSRAQDRNISLQKDVNALKKLSDKTNDQHRLISQQESAIKELKKKIDELRSEVRGKLQVVTSEIDLANKVKLLEQRLQEQDGKLNMLSIEHQLQLKNKDSKIKQLEEKANDATNALEKTKLDYDMVKNDFDRVHLMYSKKIMDFETTIRQYEKDRRRILGDEDRENENPRHRFSASTSSILKKPENKLKSLWDKKVNVTWADAARKVGQHSENKILQDSEVSSQGITEAEPYATGELQTVTSGAENGQQQKNPPHESVNLEEVREKRPKFQPKVKISRSNINSSNQRPAVAATAAPPLEIYSVRDDGNQPKKKRLYSSNKDKPCCGSKKQSHSHMK